MSLIFLNDGSVDAVELMKNLKGSKFKLPSILKVEKLSKIINGTLDYGCDDSIGTSIYSVIFKLKISVDGILVGVSSFGKINVNALLEESRGRIKSDILNLEPYNVDFKLDFELDRSNFDLSMVGLEGDFTNLSLFIESKRNDIVEYVTQIIEVPEDSLEKIKGTKVKLPIEIEGESFHSSIGPFSHIKIGEKEIELYDPNF